MNTIRNACSLIPLTLLLLWPLTPQFAKAETEPITLQQRRADQLLQQGEQQFQIGEFKAALQAWQQALSLYQAIKDTEAIAITTHNLGNALVAVGQYQAAITHYQQALTGIRALGNRSAEAIILNNLGRAHRHLSQYQQAIALHQQALSLLGETNPLARASTLNNMGEAYRRLSQYPLARQYYQQALNLFQTQGDRQRTASVLNNLGILEAALGEHQQAIQFYEQAIAIFKTINDQHGAASTYSNLGNAHTALGKYVQALDFHQRALPLFKSTGDPRGQASTLNSLGDVYRNLGQYDEATATYQQALDQFSQIQDRNGSARSLTSLGLVAWEQDQHQTAINYYQQAQHLFQEIRDREGQASTLTNLGLAYAALKRYQQANRLHHQAVEIFRDIGDPQGEASALDNIAEVYSQTGDYTQANALYQRAIAIFQTLGERENEGIVLSNLGLSLDRQGKDALAIVFLKQSVNVRESIRDDLRSLSRDQQQTYTATVAETYRRLADLLLQRDRVLEAQQVLDLLKVQELEDYLHDTRGSGQPLAILRPEAEILKQHNALQTSAIEIGRELTQLRQLALNSTLTPKQQARQQELVALERDINRQFNTFIDSDTILDLIDQLSRTAQRQNLNLEDLNALRDDLRQLDAVLFYPLILEDRLELVITTPDSPPLRRTVPVKRAELNRVIANYRSALGNPSQPAEPLAQRLYQWLIKPIEADLKQAQPQTLIYAPDGQLRYIPLSALHDGQQWLIQRYQINNITARSVTDFHSPRQTNSRLLAGAFVTGNYSVQVGTQAFDFTGLPFAGEEIKTLTALIPTTTSLVDQAFNRTATLTQLNNFNVVHWATHAQFVVGTPEASFILLGSGEQITLSEVKDLTMTDVDLIVLSACETGLGGQLGNGEEILGLGYQFQRAGARATIASLWPVSDGGTQQLMAEFYRQLQRSGTTKAAALQQAQRTLIAGLPADNGAQRSSVVLELGTPPQSGQIQRQLSHPYYWAPFILIGNGL